MNRRRFLGWAGTGATATLAGCWEASDQSRDGSPDGSDRSARTSPAGDRPVAPEGFDRVVNAVDAGADATGEEPIDDLVRELATADGSVLLVFPDGRYRVGGVSTYGVGRFGMVAAEGATPTLLPAGPSSDIGITLLRFVDADAILFDGFTLDFRKPGFGGKLHVTTYGDFALRNVRVLGQFPPEASGLHLAVEGEGGSGLVENVSMPGGGPQGGNSFGVFVDRRHAGELTFRNCVFQNFPNNGLYASAPGGDGSLKGYGGLVRVVGGLYRNNNIANVRIGGHGAVVRDVTIVVDEVPPYNELNARGILVRNGTDHRIENCRIVLGEEAGYSFGGLVFSSDAGRAFVRNTRIETNRDDLPAVYVPPPSKPVPRPSGPVFENVSITGTAGGGQTVELLDRNSTRFRNCRVVQSGDDRDGIQFVHSTRCLVADTTIDVTGVPIQNRRSSVNRREVSVN